MDTSRRDLYWMMAVFAVILIALVTFWVGGKGNEIVSYVSFASAIVSIILALVAIFYSIVQNVNSQQNIGEMKTLVSEASRIMREKAETLESAVQRFLQDPVSAKKTTTTTTPAGPTDVPASFHLTATSELARLFARFLLRSYTVGKPLPIQQFVDTVKPLVKMSPSELSSHTYGLLFGMACCLDVQLNQEQTNAHLVKLPDNFQNHLDHHTGLMRKRSPELAKYVDQIDNIGK